MAAPPSEADGVDQALDPGPRLLLVGAAWVVLTALSPGALLPGGHPLGAVLFVALWTVAAVRTGRLAWAVEWVVASVGFATLMGWLGHISWAVVPPTGIGMGVYAMVAGLAARRSARVLPAPVAAAFAWVALETLRDLFEPPVGMGWLRLGHLAAAKPYLAESARWWGVAGVSLALALVGASLPWALGLARGGRFGRRSAIALAFGALVLSLALGALGAPRTEAGPTLALIQPSIEQNAKTGGTSWAEIRRVQRDLTREAQAEGPVDLVCWSETMLDAVVVGEGVLEAVEAGVELDPWRRLTIPTSAFVREARILEELRVVQDIVGRGRRQGDLLPGTAFLTGAEEFRVLDGRLRRFNSAVLWTPDGERSSFTKQHTVPLGETMYGLERFDWARSLIGGYTADLATVDEATPLGFTDREGRTWRVGTPICFDNAYVDTFRSDVDFHVVLSNEAWYGDSWEFDQMVAFTRLYAIASGRAAARATNNGIGYACDARGRELARLTVGGRDRGVGGYLRVRLPVPSDPAQVPFFARFQAPIRWLFVALGGAAALWGSLARRGRIAGVRE